MKALVAFSWLLGQFDQQPDEYDDFTLLWSYKWILDSIASFPEINRAQIEELLADMRRRYEQFGYSERSYYYYRFSLLKDYGEVEEAQQFLDKTKAMDRDEMSDCEACEQHQFVEFEVMKGNDEQIISHSSTYFERSNDMWRSSSSDIIESVNAIISSG